MKRTLSGSNVADHLSAAEFAGRRDGRLYLQNNAGTCLGLVSSCRRPLLATVSGAALGLALAAPSLPAAAQTTWAGATSSDWRDPNNWNPAAVPTASDDVVLDTVTSNPTVVNAPGAAASILTDGLSGATTSLVFGEANDA
jgi:hypothetical protein